MTDFSERVQAWRRNAAGNYPFAEGLIDDLYTALLSSEEARVKAEVDAKRLQAMISGEWYVCFDQDGEQCRVWAVDPRSDDGSRQMTDWHDDPRAAIDAAIQGKSK